MQLNAPLQKQDSGSNVWTWFKGRPDHKPILILVGIVLFVVIAEMGTPQSMIDLLNKPNPAGYAHIADGTTILGHLQRVFHNPSLTAPEAAGKMVLLIASLAVAIFFWATATLPIGATAFLLAALMYVFQVEPVSLIAKTYMQDAVFFIIGALALAVGVEETGLDRRIGLVFLGRTKSRMTYVFVFGSLAAFVSAFISAKMLIAFLMPVLMKIYKRLVRKTGKERNRHLAVFLILTVVYMTAMGASGAPSSGARNALMVGFFRDYGKPMSYFQWMKYGIPMVPLGIVIAGLYLLFAFRKLGVEIDPGTIVKEEAEKLGRFSLREGTMAAIILVVVTLWIFAGSKLGLGGPIIIGIVLMFITGTSAGTRCEKTSLGASCGCTPPRAGSAFPSRSLGRACGWPRQPSRSSRSRCFTTKGC